jgi:hypothetical protein
LKPSSAGSLQSAADPLLLLGALIGDVVHNLRSALDHLAWQPVLRAGGEPDWRTQFPIFSTEAAYDPKSLRQTAGMAAADARKLPALQPFHDVARSWRCARHHSHGRPLPPRGSALSPELRARGAAEAILEGTAPVCPSIASRLVLPHSGEAGCRN